MQTCEGSNLVFKVLPTAKEITRELAKEGVAEADVMGKVSERLKSLEAGLSPEMEFMAAVRLRPTVQRGFRNPAETSDQVRKKRFDRPPSLVFSEFSTVQK